MALSVEDEKRLKELYELIDADGGGTIELQEVRHFVSAFPEAIEDSVIEEVLKSTSKDGSLEIDSQEFCTVAEKLQAIAKLSIPEMIQLFTQKCYRELFVAVEGGDGTGTIEKNDLRKLVESVGSNASSEDIRKIFVKYDEDGSGEIDADEFSGIVTAVSELCGLPISAVVHRFLEAQKAAQERRKQMRGWFKEKVDAPPELRKVPKRKSSVSSRASSGPRTPVQATPPVSAPCPTCSELRARVEELEALLERRTAEVGDERAQREGAESKAISLQNQIAELEQALSKGSGSEAALLESRERVKEKEKELEKMAKKVKTLEGKLKDKRHSAPAPDKDDEKDQRIRALQKMLSERDSKIDELGRRLESKDELPVEMPSTDEPNAEIDLLNSQVWTLELALGLRNKEIERLTNLITEFSRRVESLDQELADTMRRLLAQSQEKAVLEERTTLGKTINEAVHEMKQKRKGRKKRKPRPEKDDSLPPTPPPSTSELASLRHEVEVARAEAHELRRKLQEPPAAAAAPPPRDSAAVAEYEAAVARLRRELDDRDAQIKRLEASLSKAQDAIISSAGVGFEHEIKLQQARRALQTMLDAAPVSPEKSSRPKTRSVPRFSPPVAHSGPAVLTSPTRIPPLAADACSPMYRAAASLSPRRTSPLRESTLSQAASKRVLQAMASLRKN